MKNNIHSQKRVGRIGILLIGLEKANIPALQFLVLQMNLVQHAFEYEFLPFDLNDEFVKELSSRSPIDREAIRAAVPSFIDRYQSYLQDEVTAYGLEEASADCYVLVTMARFSDNYYNMRRQCVSVVALGNWERSMAPPSIMEFILTLIIREAVASVSPALSGSVHLGTKGCLFDFTASLSDVRLKVLNGFICSYCREALRRDGLSDLADELTPVLGKQWLGESTDPNSPAGITFKLGYSLFTTKGFEAASWEKFLATIQNEGVKQLIAIVGGLILAGLLLWLGLK